MSKLPTLLKCAFHDDVRIVPYQAEWPRRFRLTKQLIIALLLEKNPRVRIVATAVTLESVAELTECVKAFPFRETEAVSLTAARSRKAGAYHLMTGQNPVYIFTMQG